MYKKAILLGLVAVMAGLFWFWVEPWVASPIRFVDVSVWLKPLVMLIVLAVVEGLALLIIKELWLRVLVIVISGIPYFIIFGAGGFYLLAFALMATLQWLAAGNIKSNAEERIKINIVQIMRHGLSYIITSFLIMISFAYFLSPATQAVAKSQKLPSGISQIIEKTVPLIAGEQLQALPPAQRQNFIRQATNEVTRQFTNILGPYFKYLPSVLAFGLFLILQGLSFIFVWLAVALSVFIFWILKKSGFIRIKLMQKETEELEF